MVIIIFFLEKSIIELVCIIRFLFLYSGDMRYFCLNFRLISFKKGKVSLVIFFKFSLFSFFLKVSLMPSVSILSVINSDLLLISIIELSTINFLLILKNLI